MFGETLRVVFLSTSMGMGGADSQLLSLALALRDQGCIVRMYSLVPPGPMGEEARRHGLYGGSLEMCRRVPDPRAIFRLTGILRRERPQVLHAHMFHANLLGRIARLFVSVPVLVCTAHSIDEGGRVREILYRLSDPLCDLTTQVSQAGLRRYVRVGAVPEHKIRFLPNGIDLKKFRPDQEARRYVRQALDLGESFVWLAVGRFEEAKDYPTMLRAFARVYREHKGILLIAGQGSLQEDSKRLVHELGINDSVRFLGVRKDVPQLMNAADGYIMSSAWEGMPMVLLEASATGLPIVATDVGGNREVVLDEESGFLVPPKDPNALAKAMLRLMRLSPEQRSKMGQTARKYVETNYSLERIVENWKALYRELLERKGVSV